MKFIVGLLSDGVESEIYLLEGREATELSCVVLKSCYVVESD